MTRQQASKELRDLLDKVGLPNWKIRLYPETYKPFLGMCSYKDKTIILNAHHVDQHPTEEILDTIRHEVAHALTPGHNHDDVWAAKAKELGCANTLPCAVYSLSDSTIDAIRSGAQIEVTFEEETQVIRKPKVTISKIVDKCPTCGKVAKEQFHKIVATAEGYKKIITLECWHVVIKNADSQSPFEKITFDGDASCVHNWNKTICTKCNAKRLYPYQIEGARALEKANGRLAIFDEMGLGKTIQALAYLKFHPEAYPFLWVTKSGIKFQHCKEIVRILGMQNFPQVLMTGKEVLIPGFKGYICSYDIFRRLDLDMFAKAGIQSLILDECQAIKNPDSTRTQCIRKIAANIPKIIPLSGTPWKNRGSEFFVVLNMLDPKRFWSYKGFIDTHVESYWHGNKEKQGGIKEPEKFREYISDIAIRRERIEVLPELPLINRTKLLCEVDKAARSIYKEEEDKLISTLNNAAIDGDEDSFKTNAAVMQSLIIMRQIVGISKVPTSIEFLQDFLEETDRKIVCFVHHKQVGKMILEQMTNWCAENGYAAPLSMTADLNSIERMEVQDKFNSNKYRLLIASTLASGEGLNLQTCSDCIMHERQWNPANEEQAEGRFIRIGQTAQSVNATYVHANDTVDTDLDGIVEPKRIAFHNSMNKSSLASWNEASILQELMNKIRSKRKS